MSFYQHTQAYILFLCWPLGKIHLFLSQNPKHPIIGNITERVLCYWPVYHSTSKQDTSFNYSWQMCPAWSWKPQRTDFTDSKGHTAQYSKSSLLESFSLRNVCSFPWYNLYLLLLVMSQWLWKQFRQFYLCNSFCTSLEDWPFSFSDTVFTELSSVSWVIFWVMFWIMTSVQQYYYLLQVLYVSFLYLRLHE